MVHRSCHLVLLIGICLSSAPLASEAQMQAVNPDALPPADGYSHVVVAPAGLFVSVAAPTGPDWRWRTVITPRGDAVFDITMFNISPDSEGTPAVRNRSARQA